MRKIIILIIMLTVIAGCSVKNTEQGQVVTLKEETKQQSIEEPKTISDDYDSTEDRSWFFGTIGNAKIHAKLDISDNKVSGVYYYDKYNTNIKIEGYINEFTELKDFQTMSLIEDTDKEGEITGIFRTNDYFEGCWKKDKDIYPVYLIREGSDIVPPKQPSEAGMKFDGHWTGENSGYFAGSEADIKVLFNDLIYYELNGFNGTASGILNSFAAVNNNIAKTIFKDTTYDEKKDNVVFEFKVENKLLNLNSNMYDYMCGMGVFFDNSYVKGKIDIEMPTALEVGIVDTEEQDKSFKSLVGDRYSEFISYTSFVNYSEAILDGREVKAGISLLRGYAGACYYIISQEHIYAAIIGNEAIYYYTTDKNYADRIPEPMAEWAAKMDKIVYNFKE